jgi:ferritin-like protein
MASTTVSDVLKRAEEFERLLSDYYGRLSAETQREGVRLVADYMSRHRARLTAALERLDVAAIRRLRAEPIRYEPQAADCRCFEQVSLPPDATAAQVLDAAVTFDECLVRLYRQAARQTADLDARALFESLIRSEERDEIELKKIKAMDYF